MVFKFRLYEHGLGLLEFELGLSLLLCHPPLSLQDTQHISLANPILRGTCSHNLLEINQFYVESCDSVGNLLNLEGVFVINSIDFSFKFFEIVLACLLNIHSKLFYFY